MTTAERRVGTVVAVCLSAAKEYPKYPQPEVTITPHGIVGDAHFGELRPSHTKPGTFKPNDRAVSIVAKEVMDEVNASLGLDLHPGDFNENILVEGLGDLGDLQKGDQFFFESGVTVSVTEQNYPCTKLQDHNGREIIKATTGKQDGEVWNKRGIVGVPNQTGELRPGESVTLIKTR